MDIEDSKVIVTGGAGFIGSHLCETLVNEGCKVIVIDNLSSGDKRNLPKHDNMVFYNASILNDMALEKIFLRGREKVDIFLEFLGNGIEYIRTIDFAGVQKDVRDRTCDYIYHWIDDLKLIDKPHAILPARKAVVFGWSVEARDLTKDLEPEVARIMSNTGMRISFTCPQQAIPFLVGPDDQMQIVSIGGQERLIIVKSRPAPHVRILYTYNPELDEELIWALKRKIPQSQAFILNFSPRPLDPLVFGKPWVRSDAIMSPEKVVLSPSSELQRKLKRADKTPGLIIRSYQPEDHDAYLEFCDEWDSQMTEHGMNTSMDRRFLQMYWNDPGVSGLLAVINGQVVGAEFHVGGVSIVMKSLRETSGGVRLNDIGTVLNFELAKLMYALNVPYVCIGGLEDPNAARLKQIFIDIFGHITHTYSHLIKGDPLIFTDKVVGSPKF